MLKNILKIEGAQQLSKTDLKSINGGTSVGCGTASTCELGPAGDLFCQSLNDCVRWECVEYEPGINACFLPKVHFQECGCICPDC